MIKTLKTIVSSIILVCLFLPISQCSMKTKSQVDSQTGEILVPSETVYEDTVIANLVFNEDSEVSIESLIWFSTFSIPLLFSLLPSFSNRKRVIKLAFQSVLSVWLVYNSYQIVFGLGNPLIAGWALIASSVSFLILCFFEWFSMKHNKFKNEVVSKLTRTPHKMRRPF